MKKLSLAMALLFTLTAFASCAGGETDSTTTVAGDAGNAPDQVTTTTGPKLTLPNIPDDEPVSDEPLYEIEAFPNATSGDLALEGYEVQGYWEDGVTTDNNNLFVFTNDTMTSGKLTATFTGVEGSPSDSGIVFGMEDDTLEQIWYWENGPAYYMLFVSDRGSLYLSKVGYQGQAWTVLHDTADPIPGFVHGQEITISVEFDSVGNIKCYANDQLLIEYTDTAPLTGSRYGVRAEIVGVEYHSVVAEHN